MKIFGAQRTESPQKSVFASSTDFCRIFEKDMNRLYLLSILLTGDSELAEKAFVGGLEDAKGGNRVFKEWAESWARRTIITNAIRLIGPRPYGQESVQDGLDHSQIPAEFAAIVDLPTFERFVFVMSVLEGYSNRDCRVLLNCSNFDVAEAQARALQRLGTSKEEQGKFATIFRMEPHGGSPESALPPGITQRLAASA